jgi:hypothetical protein
VVFGREHGLAARPAALAVVTPLIRVVLLRTMAEWLSRPGRFVAVTGVHRRSC